MNNPVSSRRVLDSSKREIENGNEVAVSFEILRENGTKYLSDALVRKTEKDKSISLVAAWVINRFASPQDTSPSGTDVLTYLLDTMKGETEDGHRWDTFQGTVISGKGIHKLPAQRVKVPTANRKAEVTVEEVMEMVLGFLNLR